MSEQIKDRNAALLSVQLERVDVKARLKHAYKYLNEGKNVFSIYTPNGCCRILCIIIFVLNILFFAFQNTSFRFDLTILSLFFNFSIYLFRHLQGAYQCRVQNIRGNGLYVIRKRGHKTVVTISRPNPYTMKVLNSSIALYHIRRISAFHVMC